MAFDAERQAIINGIDSAQAEAHGWDVEKAAIPVTAVARTSATVVTITLPALPSYNITANETLTLTIPASAVTGAASIVATPTIGIAAGPGFNAQRQPILDGIVSAQSEAHGWNAEHAAIPVTAVVRTSDTVVTITLPALPSYDITATETLTVTIPAAALTGAVALVATPTITIAPVGAIAGTAALINVTAPTAVLRPGAVTMGATAALINVSAGTGVIPAVGAPLHPDLIGLLGVS